MLDHQSSREAILHHPLYVQRTQSCVVVFADPSTFRIVTVFDPSTARTCRSYKERREQKERGASWMHWFIQAHLPLPFSLSISLCSAQPFLFITLSPHRHRPIKHLEYNGSTGDRMDIDDMTLDAEERLPLLP